MQAPMHTPMHTLLHTPRCIPDAYPIHTPKVTTLTSPAYGHTPICTDFQAWRERNARISEPEAAPGPGPKKAQTC
eukprot:9723920-Heterocapsa_arctica.AAC.1